LSTQPIIHVIFSSILAQYSDSMLCFVIYINLTKSYLQTLLLHNGLVKLILYYILYL
jgi:hypothetical protein